ncbi:hypothetical protein RJ639_008246 [Escallonia herrerae]|uniref:Integrase catalytic domain-containing protein n=1 Tax=Escallonia herrerae TaxID=1293975 RepID=A0AA88VQ92_9ASTE|nr:hypothetical protein RJ639_008246 [Escallonia herrerae]
MFDGIVRTLGDVRYILDLKKNLISLGTLDSIDCSISIKGGVMKVSKGAMVIMKCQKTENLYKLMEKTVIGGASVSTHASSSNDNSELWHKRLGHLSEGDDFSRKVWVYFMKHKSEVFNVFKQWKARVENQTGKKLKYFRSDNGMEYKDEEFLQFCKDKGIIKHFSVKRTPEQNGVTERMKITLLERARCMRLNADLPKSFWAEAVNTACYLVNCSPSSVINHRVPEELWFDSHDREVQALLELDSSSFLLSSRWSVSLPLKGMQGGVPEEEQFRNINDVNIATLEVRSKCSAPVSSVDKMPSDVMPSLYLKRIVNQLRHPLPYPLSSHLTGGSRFLLAFSSNTSCLLLIN